MEMKKDKANKIILRLQNYVRSAAFEHLKRTTLPLRRKSKS